MYNKFGRGVEPFVLPGGVLPTKEALLQYKLAQAIQANIAIGQKFFQEFKPNENQQRVKQLIDTSTVPEGEWLHVLLFGEPRSGKTWGALYYILDVSLRVPFVRTLSIRNTTSELNASIFLDVDKFASQWNIPILKRSTHDGLIQLGNMSEIHCKSDKSITPGAKDNTGRKLGGMEYFFGMVEEADTVSSETARAIPHRLSQKIPGNFRKVIFYTQNPPDKDHWTYEFFFNNPLGKPDDPASPIRALYCPLSGNVENIGEAYRSALSREYLDDPAMHARFALGQFAPSVKGDPIFKQTFNRSFHVASKSILSEWNRGEPLLRGWDFGFRGNACTILQDDPDRRQLRIFKVYFQRKVMFEQFCDMVLAKCYRDFPGARWLDYPDPHGDQHTSLSEYSYHDIMRAKNLELIYDKRKRSVVKGVNLISKELRSQGKAGTPALLIDPDIDYLIEAFQSGYCNSKNCQIDELRPVEDNTYIHVMDSLRYPIVMIREFPLDGQDAGEIPFQVMRDGAKIIENMSNQGIYTFGGNIKGAGRRSRDSFSRSRFAR